MSPRAPVTLYHNPKCGTSRTALALIREAGYEPEVVEYLEAGWTRALLTRLLEQMGTTPREILRTRGTPAEELGLLDPAVPDDVLLDAMLAHPALVERPIVVGPRGTVLARPAERVRDVL